MSGINVTLQVQGQMFGVNVQQAIAVDPANLAEEVQRVAGELVDRVVATIAVAVPAVDANDANLLRHTHPHPDFPA